MRRIIEYFYDPALLPLTGQNLANYITLCGVWLARLSMYFFFVILFYYWHDHKVLDELRYAAIGLSIVSSILDGVDGWIARRFNCLTDLGKIFDPHHDKTQYACKTNSLIIDSLITYGLGGTIGYFVFAMGLKFVTDERDETVGFHRLWVAQLAPQADLQAKWSGKWRTRLCFGGIPLLHLLIRPFDWPPGFQVLTALLIAITLVSLYQYVGEYRRVIRKNDLPPS